MSGERLSYNPEEQMSKAERLSNEDEIQRILAVGTEEERLELEKHHHIPPEDMVRFIHFASMRHEIHQQMQAAFEHRRQENPEKTAEEQALGVYWEEIEPPVRAAVRTLRTKGYETTGSGFWGPTGAQRMYLGRDYLSNFSFIPEFVAYMKERGVSLEIEPAAVSFSVDRKMSETELRAIWNEIVEQLPAVV